MTENSRLPPMGASAGDEVMGHSAGSLPSMPEPPPRIEAAEGADAAGYPEMIPAETEARITGDDAASFAAGDQGEGYLRLVIAVEGDTMSVIDAAVIAGGLVEQPDLTGEIAYEATIEERRVGSEAFADLSEIHSLAPPDRPELGHHFGRAKSFDFVVRIPRGEITQSDLSKLEIELYRLGSTTQLSEDIRPAPGVTFERAASERGRPLPATIARLFGVDLQQLPQRAAEAVRRGLR